MRTNRSFIGLSVATMLAAALPMPSVARSLSSGPSPKGAKVTRTLRSRVRLNRSRKWADATTYKEARAMSPFPERPVR